MILPDQEQKRRWKALREQIKRSQSESRENRVEKFIAEVEEGYALVACKPKKENRNG
ncbi:hypothetical protein [Azotobacter beijerinckii]|uniref:Uncharacterized protein n=1 Tax=Azotobacter beijerinckii TaxID=170623 RepID=A0A1I0Z3E0_9GAMM|nr:hypothetical protein [Azotobacter beijerinckii]SFB19626.1 hypothetical protein SAMN04244571_01745 [Azotobacter beijerinckii]